MIQSFNTEVIEDNVTLKFEVPKGNADHFIRTITDKDDGWEVRRPI